MAHLLPTTSVDECFDAVDYMQTCVGYFIFNEKNGACTCLTGDGACEFVDGNQGGASIYSLSGSGMVYSFFATSPQLLFCRCHFVFFKLRQQTCGCFVSFQVETEKVL
jgi:hypothetical protein